MKLKYIFGLTGTFLMLSSCSDFLDKAPISDNVNEGFFTSANQLEAYCNAKYNLLPGHGKSTTDFGYFSTDNNSDNQAGTDANDNFIPQRIQVPSEGSYEKMKDVRDCNLFLTTTEENIKNGTLSGSDKLSIHYIGEMFFFRAYLYFGFLKQFGDFPIIETVLTDEDYAANVEANKRRPRNEVARFILSDLDKAIARLEPKSSSICGKTRINRETAYLFKSRVALYEASWERYHSGTARVPGGPGWPGKDFTGDLNSEITFFLDEAKKAAFQVASVIDLETDYAGMFNTTDCSSQKEILLWRMYSAEAKVQNLVLGSLHGNEVTKSGAVIMNGGNTGYTRSLVESFLMVSGKPWYAAGNEYMGDKDLKSVCENRDLRLVTSMYKTDDVIQGDRKFQFPAFTTTGSIQKATTGYIPRKGWLDNDVAINSPYPLALPVFRVAEAYLNYIEADYMDNNQLDENSDKYWRALRKRAGISEDYQATIKATDLTKEIDLAKYSGADLVDETLYNIRRERRCEFIAEGMRLDDLYRWRSLDHMKNYHTEGMNYWDEMAAQYANVDATFNLSPAEYVYLRPYWNNVAAKDGYTFEEANYLSPLSYDVFRLSTPEPGGNVSTSVVYQNPGWPVEAGGYAIN